MSKYISVSQTNEAAKQALDLGIEQLSTKGSEITVKQLISVIHKDAIMCLKKFNESFKIYKNDNSFKKAWEFTKSYSGIEHKTEDQKKEYVAATSKIQEWLKTDNNKNAKKYIENLNECRVFLQEVRTILTNQTINTKFFIQTKGKIYTIDEKVLNSRQLQYTLSNFGSSPLNLAYKLDVDIEKLVQQGLATEISATSIYNRIWNAKIPYLKKKSEKTNKTYKRVFNSKDAEIFSIVYQEMLKKGITSPNRQLTNERYAELRRLTGSGNPTSQFQLGDAGLEQDKLIVGEKGSVTLSSHAVIFNNLTKLVEATQPGKALNETKQALKDIFLPSQKENESKLSYEIMTQAEGMIDQLFAVGKWKPN